MLKREETSLDRSRLSRLLMRAKLCAAIMVTTITIAVCLPDTSAIYGTCTNFDFAKKLFSWNELRSYFGYRNAWQNNPSLQPCPLRVT